MTMLIHMAYNKTIKKVCVNMCSKVLVIDDDFDLCRLVQDRLSLEGIDVVPCYNGASALSEIVADQYILVILDIIMPDLDGFTILEKIRSYSNIPVLMLTAVNDKASIVQGLQKGADVYLTKPFDISELVARTFSLIRRYTSLNSSSYNSILPFKDLVINPSKHTVFLHNQELVLSKKEFDVLLYLAQNAGAILTKKDIYEHVWKQKYLYDAESIMAVVSRLRKKIQPSPSNHQYIQTVKGIGYRFVAS